jgi:hypothetical protein
LDPKFGIGQPHPIAHGGAESRVFHLWPTL